MPTATEPSTTIDLYPAMGEVLTLHPHISFSERPPNRGNAFEDYAMAFYDLPDPRWTKETFAPSYVEYDGYSGNVLIEHYDPVPLNGIYMGMPGMGRARADCGSVTHRITDDNPDCDHPDTYITKHCDRLTCPKCSEKVRLRQAREIEERLESVWQRYKDLGLVRGDMHRHLKHVTLSPDPSQVAITEQGFLLDKDQSVLNVTIVKTEGGDKERHKPVAFRNQDNLTRTAKQILKNATVRDISPVSGGVLVFHGYRRKHLDGTSCEDDHCMQDHQWQWSPHFHFIGFGWFRSGKEIHEETGWVLKNIKNKGKRSAFATVSYILSHATIIGHTWMEIIDQQKPITGTQLQRKERSRHTYRWIGDWSNYAIELSSQETIEEPDICPQCGTHRSRIKVYEALQGDYIDYGEMEPHYQISVVKTYAIRQKYLVRLGKDPPVASGHDGGEPPP